MNREAAEHDRLDLLRSRQCPRCAYVPIKLDATFHPDDSVDVFGSCPMCHTDFQLRVPREPEVAVVLPPPRPPEEQCALRIARPPSC